MAGSSIAEGNALLYHFFQKTLLEEDADQFAQLTARLVTALGIWFPPQVYKTYPILVPYAVRDPDCRPNKRNGFVDQWGAPNERGLFRDDNSLVKGLPRSLQVINPHNRLLHLKRLGTSFVASHVWRKLVPSGDAPRDRLAYSFVPNLVWLPSQLSKLSDREGGFVQTYLQAVSRHIYKDLPLTPGLADVVNPVWERFEIRDQALPVNLPDPASLNYFEFQPKWVQRRLASLDGVLDAVEQVQAGTSLQKKVVATRYGDGLPSVSAAALGELSSALSGYRLAVSTPDQQET